MKTFFLSDTHFGHKNIIRYEHRPFASLEQMDEYLIQRWNSVVSSDDVVIHGGDFALCKKDIATSICHRLNGYKILVHGNHDRSKKSMLEIGFNEVVDYYYDGKVLVFHYPYIERNETVKTLYSECEVFLFGHVHTRDSEVLTVLPKAINICCEKLDYTPKTLEQLLEQK